MSEESARGIASGIQFATPADGFFAIEESATMRSLGVKTCEFVLFRKHAESQYVVVIEAKSSAPRPPSAKARAEPWNDFMLSIYEKMLNSILVLVGLKTGRPYKAGSQLPTSIDKTPLSDMGIVPCLVLKDHPPEALVAVQDALNIELKDVVASFCLNPLVVINAAKAIQLGLAILTVP